MNPNKIGKFIYELRKERNLSQYQLADMIPISRQAVSKWERGKTIPDTQTLIRLSDLFNVSINELLNGERTPKLSIEETTLSILDQSNKKTKAIKRIITTSTIIITVLLLSFLSYYFINSYNSIEVYTISGKSNQFRTYGGLMIITKEKVYMKLGRLKYKDNIEIKNLKLYYKKNNKKILIVEDKEADNIVIRENIGYEEKLKAKNINNLYLEITYNNEEKEIIKLESKKDFVNNSLFFTKQQYGKEKEKETIKVKEEIPIKEEKKEEATQEKTNPAIQEIETPKQTNNNKPVQPAKEEPIQEPPKEPEITIDQVISKIKEKCMEDFGSYACEYENILIFYYADTNLIEIMKNEETIGEYSIKEDRYVCTINNCKEEFKNIFKTTLFS